MWPSRLPTANPISPGDDAHWLDKRMKIVARALQQLGTLMRLSQEEIEDRLTAEEASSG
jgi:hypothetical protein